MKLYSTQVDVIGGRNGRAHSSDGRLALALSVPRGLGGDDGPGTNPEQLFAAGYAACFDSAIGLVARKGKITLPSGSGVSAEVGLERTPAGAFGLVVALTGHFPGMPETDAHRLMEAAHQVCPYSNATRGNIQVELRVADDAVATAAA